QLQAKLQHLQKVQRWALESESAKHINAMLDLARSEDGIPVLPQDLDRDPWLLNCANGTVELKTGRLREHRRSDYITKLCPTEYHPDAPCPLWEPTLWEVFGGKESLVGYLRRLLGYCLSGSTTEHMLVVCHGCGANGKSTILNAILNTLGM